MSYDTSFVFSWLSVLYVSLSSCIYVIVAQMKHIEDHRLPQLIQTHTKLLRASRGQTSIFPASLYRFPTYFLLKDIQIYGTHYTYLINFVRAENHENHTLNVANCKILNSGRYSCLHPKLKASGPTPQICTSTPNLCTEFRHEPNGNGAVTSCKFK